jgi:starch synthase
MKVLIAHPGTQYSHQIVKQFYRLGVLYRYWTGLCIPESKLINAIAKLLPASLRTSLSNRTLQGIPRRSVRCYPINEIRAIRRLKSAPNAEQILFPRNRIFQEGVSARDIRESDLVVGFDTSSWVLAERAKEAGKPFILDYSTIHSKAKLRISEEALRQYPEWAFDVSRKTDEHLGIEERELKLADRIVVASSFTKQTLVDNGVPTARIAINPYGVDSARFLNKTVEGERKSLRFVFVGAVNTLKGIPMLIDYLSSSEGTQCDFTIIGPIQANVREAIHRRAPHVQLLGKIAHARLPSVLSQYDVMVFPSYYDGFALVILEAMSMGLAVITTRNTCGPDVIENGVDGIVIPSGDQSELRRALGMLNDQPDMARKIGQAAAVKARTFSWDQYGDRWSAILHDVIKERGV